MRPHTIRSLFTRGRIRMLVSAVGALALLVGMAVPVFAAHENKFQLDGNTAVDANPNQPFDWESFFQAGANGDIVAKPGAMPNAAGFIASGAQADYTLPDKTTFATGSKDTLDI